MLTPANPAHGLWLEVGGVRRRVTDPFSLSLALEERFGPLPAFMSRGPSSFTVRDVADFLGIALATAEPPATATDIAAHINNFGRARAVGDMARVIELVMVGWEGLRDAAGANPPPPAATAGSPGTTSSAPPVSSDGVPPTSGAPGPSSSAPSSGPNADPLAAMTAPKRP